MNNFRVGDKVRRIGGGGAPLEVGEVYTVDCISNGFIGVEEYKYIKDDTPFDALNFELVEQQSVEHPLCPVLDQNHIIIEWLDKYGTVYNKCPDVGGIDLDVGGGNNHTLTTDHGDIRGMEDIVLFINMRYASLKTTQDAKRKQELEDKRLKVLAELSEIDQELGRY